MDMDEVKEEDLDMGEANEEYFYMDKVEAEESVEAALVSVEVVVEAVDEEEITIVTTAMEGRIKNMELIHHILRETLHLKEFWLLFKLMYGKIFLLDEVQSKGGSIITTTVISQQYLMLWDKLLKLYKKLLVGSLMIR